MASRGNVLGLTKGPRLLELLLLEAFVFSSLLVGFFSLLFLDIDSYLLVDVRFQFPGYFRSKLIQFKFISGITIVVLLDAALDNGDNALLLLNVKAVDHTFQV